LSFHPLEAIAEASDGAKWFQLYCSRDQGLTHDLIARAEAAGFEAICVTADIPVAARRETDERNRLSLPPSCLPGNLAAHMQLDGLTGSQDGSALVRLIKDMFDPSLTWKDIEALRLRSRLPFLVKGILEPADAQRAIDHGLDGIVVSNHGGRQLDCAPATIDALPAIAKVVDGRIAVLLDSGIRRGSDVVKAIALGADAVLIGRPMMWGLALEGQQGVAQVLEMLRDEIERTLALIGCPRLADLGPELVRRFA
jgi:4-hydroxymandelate oxidase